LNRAVFCLHDERRGGGRRDAKDGAERREGACRPEAAGEGGKLSISVSK
jgi:hypothetical protein